MTVKRIISALLVVCMMITALPGEIFAAENHQRTNLFSDIKKQDWFYEDVLYAYENNLFSGTSEDIFSPDKPITRAMFVTVIGRMENIDTSMYSQSPTFIDVKKGSYYAPYVEWAKQMGITSGTGSGKFSPDALLTRQDMATFTVRYLDAYGYTYPEASITTLPKDLANISSYAKDAVLKLWSAGLLKGDGNGYFNPLKTATRAENAAFCSRIHRYISQKEEIPVTSGDSVKKYEVKFETYGGGTIASRKLRSGAALSNLPVPYKENSIFAGWYYDEGLTMPVSASDKVNNDMTLYAKYFEAGPIKEDETPHFASALDQRPDFTIKVVSKQQMTADEVKKAVTAKNLSSTIKEDFITVSGSGTNFIISGTNGFEEGATFKLTLEDENLSFEGFPDSVRDYIFTIAKEKVLNFSLDSDIVYIPASEITNITGRAKAPITLNNSGLSEAEASGGTFTYSGSTALKVGDKISIYEGTRPDLRTVDNDNDGDILYVKITGKSGDTYTYTSMDAEEVLFTPDVLPVSKNADTDGNAYNHSITVPVDTLDFSDDIYQNIGLDSQTTVDAGDFIAFYDGVFGQDMQSITYAEITAVKVENGSYIIEYKIIDRDEMLASMDAYDTNQVSGGEMLRNVNKEAIERNVEHQALESGFAEEAALYLASMALQTNSFTELSSDYDLTDIQIKTPDGYDLADGEFMLMDNKKVEVDITKLKATLSKELEYFDNYDGLRLTLELGVEIKIHANDESDIVIEITGKFEQEVRIDINVDGGAIWKWWGPIPYIAEYEATASIDLFNYTGIGIEAVIITSEAEEDDLTGTDNKTVNDISKQLKELMDAKDKYIGDGSGTVAQGLADKYKAMLENEDSGWVELFSADIFKREFNICLIIAVEVGVEFVVSANVNVSLGMDFYYANAKRYIYTVAVFTGTVESDVVDIVEEQYQFEFYVMGTLGLRAGIKAEIKVGLFTTKLASVGFAAEAGAYVRVWGYFYYQLRWTASRGKATKSSGALLFELGIYLEVTFEAQAFNGTFSYNPTLYDNEWPLWYAGMRENIQDFAYEQKEAPELSMKKTIRTVAVPDDLFEMEYMDLKTGEIESKIYDDATNFRIEITNDAFKYDPQTNILTVTPGDRSIQEGQMIITWIASPLAFTSAPIQRRIDLYWDNYNDGYSIAFNSNGGSVVPMIIQRFGGNVRAPEAPVKQGYIFGGWYSDPSLENEYTIPAVMPDMDCIVYAKWIPASDTKYEVLHYTQEINGSYTLAEKESFTGTTDSTVIPQTKSYTGFTSPALQEAVIKPDGSTKVNYYYKRNSYTVYFEPGNAGGETVTAKFKYGTAITAPILSREGYEFVGWNKPLTSFMPAGDITYIALWAPKSDTPYRVEHYVMETDGRYKLKEIEHKTGDTDQVISAKSLKKANIEVENAIKYSGATVKGSTAENVVVKSDGSLVVKLYYDRSKYDITFKQRNGNEDIKKSLRYEENVILPETPVLPGYTFGGWYTDDACTTALGGIMPANDLIAYAKWIVNTNTPYKVEHYVMGTDGSYSGTPVYTDYKTGTTDTICTVSEFVKPEILVPNGIIYHHAEVGGSTATQARISGDGSLVIKLYYERKAYNLTWDIGEGIAGGNYTPGGRIYYGAPITPPTLSRAGYSYVWDNKITATMPAEDLTYVAIWTANTNTPYQVEHYMQNIADDNYTLAEREYFTGTTDTTATAQPKGYEYFTLNPSVYGYLESGNINGDGSLVLKLYYDRDKFTVTFDAGEGIFGAEASQVLKHGATVATTDPAREGYGFGGWYMDEACSDDKRFSGIMPAKDITLYAKWVAGQVSYKVEHYVMDTSGNYPGTPNISENRTGIADSELILADLKNSSLEITNAVEFKEAKIGDIVSSTALVAADGTLTVKMYYERRQYTLSWDLDGGTANNDYTEGAVYYGASIIVPANLVKTGYTYVWSNIPADTMPANDLTYTAIWTANTYSVIFNANDGTNNAFSQDFVYDEAKDLTANSFERTGYTFSGWSLTANGHKVYSDCERVQNLTAVQNGQVSLYAVWTPINYTITYTTAYGSVDITAVIP